MKQTLKQPYKQFFGTIANPVRLDIIEYLQKQASNVNGISKHLKYNQSTISHSLSRLEKCGFVTVERKGKERIYTLNQETIRPLFRLMQNHMTKYCAHIVAEKNGKGCC